MKALATAATADPSGPVGSIRTTAVRTREAPSGEAARVKRSLIS